MNGPYVDTVDELRALFPPPGERARAKQLHRLDRHCRRFIELSPFLVLATGADGLDASPRGGAPGIVRVVDDATLLIPDAPGNNRLDSLTNLVRDGRAGILFLIPGVDETLRVNGDARIRVDAETLNTLHDGRRLPTVAIEVTVREAYLHCAKALMRSRLWSDGARIERSALPTLGEMLAEQTGTTGRPETQEEMIERYRRDL